jgi:hypothetical protein
LNGSVLGIDFVEVEHTAQSELWVYFVRDPDGTFTTAPGAFTQAGGVSITSRSETSSRPRVGVVSADWTMRQGKVVLHVVTEGPGDFSYYSLSLVDSVVPSRVDPFFNGVPFRFQAGCPSDLDCAPPETECPPVTEPDVPIDYSARDFGSFRRALMEFAAARWPNWSDRLEADLGVMLAELMAATGDEMAYYQDRVAREASLRTATQRRSLRHHVRLMDHQPHDGLAPWTFIRVTVGLGALPLPAGTEVRTPQLFDPSGLPMGQAVRFQIGTGLRDTTAYDVRFVWNELAPKVWDIDADCLSAGATFLDVEGQWKTGPDPLLNKWVLLQTTPVDPAVPARAQVVRVIDMEEIFDPLAGTWATRLHWSETESTPWSVDLDTLLVHANIVPAVAGRAVPAPTEPELLFRIPDPDSVAPPPGFAVSPPDAIARSGPNGTPCYYLPLRETELETLCFLGEAAEYGIPDVVVERMAFAGDPAPTPWIWQRALIGSPTAGAADEVFTLEDGLWDEVARYFRGDPEPVRTHDYRSGSGFTVRFGDGTIGALPTPDSVFRVRYRVGGGSAANVGANTLVECANAAYEVTNPLPVASGRDPQSDAELRKLAPEAWKAQTYRAVRKEDYAEALTRLPWVDRAGAQLHWTGSWLTLFGTPDPRDSVSLSAARRAEAEAQLDRFRMAGRETHVLPPVYAWLDLRIRVCVDPASYRGDVKAAVTRALFAEGGPFDPDTLSFGDPLRRSLLFAALQAVPGVRAVESVEVRRRGHFDWSPLGELLSVGVNEVIGVANDPSYPERGSLRLFMEGGA